MEHEGDSDANCNWYTRNDPQSFETRAGRFENRRASEEHPEYSIIKNG